MRAKNSSNEQNDRTLTEAARRAQIVEAAIETIAELGYARTSFAQIAKRAGLSSTGVISYHFDGKDELMTQVMTDVLGAFSAFVGSRTDGETTAAGTLRAFLEANVAFMRTHRDHLAALLELAANSRSRDAGRLEDRSMEPDLAALESLLRKGQEQGEFRQFDVKVMAIAIRSVRDGLIHRLTAQPDLDLDACAREIVTMFDLATRNGDE